MTFNLEQVRVEGWQIEKNSLCRNFVFSDFSEAFGFMTRIAMLCEAMNHHPEWNNCYNRLHIKLYTYSTGGITEKDLRLAQQINQIANSCATQPEYEI
jgi:4a-hydroxytetrahydrobiopterin dehydratase